MLTRNIFNKLDTSTTTPSPECKKAQDAYKAYCSGTLNKDRLERCAKEKKWKDANPAKAQKKKFNEAVAELAKQENIINDEKSTQAEKDAAKAAKKNIPSVGVLIELAKMEKNSQNLRQEAERLAAAVRKLDNCPLPDCEGENDCNYMPPDPMPDPMPPPMPPMPDPMPPPMPPMPDPMPPPMPPMPPPMPPMPPMPPPMPPMPDPMPPPMPPMPPMPDPMPPPMPPMPPMKIARAKKLNKKGRYK